MSIKECFYSFWDRNPALFLGLSLLLGTAIAFKSSLLLIVLFVGLCCTAVSKKALMVALLCFISAYFNATYRHPKIILPQAKAQGAGIFHVEQVKISSSPFTRSILYKGVLKHFKADDGSHFEGLPCNIYLPLFGKKCPATTDYEIKGTLSQKDDHAFVLKPEKKTPWTPLPSLFNLAEWRFRAKQAVLSYLKKEIADPHARTFLNALATGDVDERILHMEFGKVGLQHVLAISGFHFAFVALLLCALLRLLFPDKISSILLIVALSFYYLFLGNAPSIQRAYIAVILVVIGRLFSLRISGLNALGAALIAELFLNPLTVTQLNFQLSFLCTFALLLFYPIVHRWIAWALLVRPYADIKAMSLFDKHGYLLSALLRKALAVNIAVHLISLPVLLHIFHKFPLLSLAYNLFFPFLVCLSMFLLFITLILAPLLPFLSHTLHALNNAWTSAILSMTTRSPAFLDFSIRSKAISFSFTICFLAAAFFLGVLLHEKEQRI